MSGGSQAGERDGTAIEPLRHRLLVGPAELAVELAGDGGEAPPPLVLDVRWQLGRYDGFEQHLRRRIPGSVYVDLERELSGPRTPGSGRHPLPERDRFAASMARWGLRPGRDAVAYDDSGGLAAARLWWLLRWAGHRQVRVLDGGLAAWTASGLELEEGPAVASAATADSSATPAVGRPAAVRPAAGSPETRPVPTAVLDAAGAAALARAGVLLDARAGERYRGEHEPVDPVAGHIPGAISAPTGSNLDGEGRFLDGASLRNRFASLGADGSVPVGVYCGSGVTAAHEILALELAGIPAALYPGSWSEWVADPRRPVAVGDEPG